MSDAKNNNVYSLLSDKELDGVASIIDLWYSNCHVTPEDMNLITEKVVRPGIFEIKDSKNLADFMSQADLLLNREIIRRWRALIKGDGK